MSEMFCANCEREIFRYTILDGNIFCHECFQTVKELKQGLNNSGGDVPTYGFGT